MDKEKRRIHILDVAEQCFKEFGYSQTSMDFLSKRCELTKRTIYKYFGSKDEIYFELVSRSHEKFKELYALIDEEQSAINQISELMRCYIEFYKAHPFYANLMVTRKTYELDDPIVLEKIRHIESFSKKIPLPKFIQKGIDEGSIRDDIDANQQALIIWGALHGVMEIAVNKTWLISDGDIPNFLLKSKMMLIQAMKK